jgi:LmbE family N-acetylglucosaminyl deacetylase
MRISATRRRQGLPARRRVYRVLQVLLVVIVVSLSVAQTTAPAPAGNRAQADPKSDFYQPLPQDTGVAGLKQILVRLNTTARLMQTTAHPDDEDGGMLTLESRGKGVSEVLMTLTRGEGGQNKLGSNLFDVLGVLRTLELLASDRYYDVEQRFSRVADFGYSKNADETFQKWGGHDVALGDMVRVIRTFRPDILIARFSGTERDGHGHHQASAILAREAFRAAGDSARFPEQIKEGLAPWQPKKFYMGNVCGFMAMTCADENYTVKLNTGEPSDALGMSYVQFAMEGLRHQQSQGAAGWTIPAGPRYTFYKLVDSVLPPPSSKDNHEADFFEGIDTSLTGLASRLGKDEASVPFLRPALAKLQQDVDKATAAAAADPSNAAVPLLDGLQTTNDLIAKVDKTDRLSPEARNSLLADLRTKQHQFETAANLALGVGVTATVQASEAATPETAFMAVPGQPLTLNVLIANHSLNPISLDDVELDLTTAKTHQSEHNRGTRQLAAGQQAEIRMTVTPVADAAYTRPYWHRDDPETDTVNKIDDPQYLTLPFPPPPVSVHVRYSIHGLHGEASATGMVKFQEDGMEREHPVAVAPAFSVALEPSSSVIPAQHEGDAEVKVAASNNVLPAAPATSSLELPSGWKSTPQQQPVTFSKLDESKDFFWNVFPADLKEERHQVKAALQYDSKKYGDGYTVVTRADLGTFYYYQPATQRVSVVEVAVPPNLKVGYIMGAGDDIPTVLKEIGINLTLIPAEKIATEDLSQFQTIVLGIRAYDTQKALAANNKKLLDFVSAGGTLIVQYEAAASDFNNGHFTPYPAQLSRARVSVEEAPVEILAPDDPVFHYPNTITARDFNGWVQERGLYFMDQWDDHFKPLLACHDPGEQPQKGGLLKAQYGKGMYIYNAYAFFRQLPAGVPGAVRLYVNLLSVGSQGSHSAQGSGAGR